MRFLHTGDWHLGKTLRGRSRLPEQQRALQQLGDAAVAAKVDAVLVAGDVFDSTMPPPDAEALAFEFLARLCKERIGCVLIAGNHDSPARLEALRRLLEPLQIHVRAEPRPASAGGVVELRSRDGQERALVAALPFVPERKVVDALALLQEAGSGHQLYSERVAAALAALCRSFAADAVNIALLHVLISGATFGTGVRQLHLGEIYALSPERLPANAHYAALGHLHRPQEIAGAPCRAAYAGSLVELDFGEREQQKRAVLVEAGPGRPARLEDVPLDGGRRLCDVRGTLGQLAAQRDGLGDAWLRVTVLVDEPLPGVEDKVRALLPDALEVRQEWPRQQPVAGVAAADAGAVRDPQELFADFHRHKHGIAPSRELLQLFQAVRRQAAGEDGEA